MGSGTTYRPLCYGKSNLVGKGRLELPRLSAHDPKSCSSTSSDTSPLTEKQAYNACAELPKRGYPNCLLEEVGDPPRGRTENLLIKSQLLCQLS